jgi:monofunctional glycosyltransferase
MMKAEEKIMKWNKKWTKPTIGALGLILILFILNIFVFSVPDSDIASLAHAHVKYTYKNGKVEYEIVNKRPSSWVPFDQISKEAREAIVISEDALFWTHDGFDYEQIKDAVEDHFEKGKKLRGASTITQQLVKNLFLTKDKTLSRKAKEALITKELEDKVKKKKILETYLNIIEYGEGIYGIKAASNHYFGKHPSELNAKEGAFLAMLLPNPKKHSSSFRKKELTPFAKKRINDILHKMKATHKIDQEKLDLYKSEKLNFEKVDPPVVAPDAITNEETSKKDKKKGEILSAEELAELKRIKKRNKFDKEKLDELKNMVKGLEQDKVVNEVRVKAAGSRIENLKSPGDLATNEKLIQDEVIGVEEEMSLE